VADVRAAATGEHQRRHAVGAHVWHYRQGFAIANTARRRMHAMHMPDGFISAPVALAAGVVAVGGVAYCIRGARRTLDERMAPMAGLTAAFIFAVQMLNFPVAAGTSGHLLGGALAAVLIGPYAGALAVTTVLIVQALLFADGGLTALGLNIINMAFVTTVVAWFVFRGLMRVLPKTRTSVVVAGSVGAFLSVPASALAFTLEYAIGGTATFDVSQVLVAMVGVHGLIGIGEAVITGLTLAAVLAARPDLVYGARDLLPKLDIRSTPVSVPGGAA
jgi:cobalt/nickel transport system permease protein